MCMCVCVHVCVCVCVCVCRFLGYVDKIGVAYEADTIATGFGAYLALVSLLGNLSSWVSVLSVWLSLLCLVVTVLSV